ncbi:PEP-CTERM sorting domain-containing protein [Leptolyngbya sp. 'hensonii']|uniref:choice-of-anchor L family PEP-CTERM protein n=1 Tax=Leptolyngbya sp. 'hensonii' TaxID=1922337 RepID=UPI00094F9635|nr:choice-of-anchor L domain-containing protein [Leptolyngbya sp. 'hensonii']OLP16922.1 PEP-CTERM sorting domain-containing protein [Leptolyngbya sp. 'hensonii']
MKLLQKFTAILAVTAATFGVGSSAMAFSITQNNNSSALLNALLGNTDGLSNFSVTATGDAAAFGLFSADPFGLDNGIVLSTGKAQQVAGVNTVSNGGSDFSTDFGSSGATGDTTSLEISFDADATADKLFFQYVFGSEEFVEYGGSQYNDKFELLLNGVNLAKLSDGKDVTINNLVPNPSGPYHADYVNNPAGPSTVTKLDGYTQALTFEGLLNKNAKNTLTIKIQDVGDGIYDSAVFLKGGSLGTKQLVPEPGVVLGLMAVGGLMLQRRRLKKA